MTPTYTLPYLDAPLLLTGRGDDPAWGRAPVVSLVEVADGAAPRWRTEARMAYDAAHLYVAFFCEDDYVWGTHATRDAPIYEEECVEVFLCPSGHPRHYFEIDVSPRNTVFDAFILNGGDAASPARRLLCFTDYTCEGLRTAVWVDGDPGVPGGARGWSAEFAIPFAALIGAETPAPRPGDRWPLNLYRIDAPQDAEPAYTAWSPTGLVDFHRPWQFGVGVFGG